MSDVFLTGFISRHRLDDRNIDIDETLESFFQEMDRGLTGESSSLKMIPTYISDEIVPAHNRKVIVIDAGGTNLRVALVSFDSNGFPVIEDLNKYSMPGIQQEISATQFFDTIGEYLAPFMNKSDRIGFCFSYPAEITENRDGRLIHWTKDIKVPELEGQLIGRGLLESLGESGKDKKITILNDTIATLLAGRAQSSPENFSNFVGLILGTGTNMAYVEKNANISKLYTSNADGSQAINMESGGFSLAPSSDFDRQLDAATINPGDYLFEKMIAGLYRGKLVLLALQAAARENLFSAPYASKILAIAELEAVDADNFLRNSTESPLLTDTITDVDYDCAAKIINAIYRRAAKLTAISIAAAVIRSASSGDKAVCVNIDGSTYYKSIGFREMVEEFLSQILGTRKIAYKLIHVDNAPVIGAAIGGLAS